MEFSNGFNELNDPYDQADRFKQQEASSAHGNEEAHQFDSDYVHALEYALPPTVGVGIGIDRLTMLLLILLPLRKSYYFLLLNTNTWCRQHYYDYTRGKILLETALR